LLLADDPGRRRASARAFRARLADRTELAAYKAKLPADAQGDGLVILYHTRSSSTAPFSAAATYDVALPAGPLGFGSTVGFDAAANPVSAGEPTSVRGIVPDHDGGRRKFPHFPAEST
jgi:hypothetical protein